MTRQTLLIDRLGAQGDGIAETPSGPVYVPFALPGETVEALVQKGRAQKVELQAAAPQRVKPVCRHFGECGGCAAQHLEAGAYSEWKRDKLVRVLAARGIAADVASLAACPPASRRRVMLSARRLGAGVVLGFNAAQSHRIVAIEDCPVAVPEIVAALDALRDLAKVVAATPKAFHMAVTATATGLDIAVEGSGRLGAKQRRAAVDCTLAKGFARLTVDGEVVVEARQPTVLFGDVPVILPPGGFLQATAGAEAAMAGLVETHLEGAGHVADLFAGSGTFALRLARRGRVYAVEGDAAALAALDRAARQWPALKPVTAEKRDLFHRPLTAKELAAFDGLVFDPPRAGAEAQCRQIAASGIPRVAAVSCNPGTLARDLAILCEGGYRVRVVVPIDQFLWSPHVEAVALLERTGRC
ncbi:class I SAM-dependent RNA methyltransferase [Nitratireductor sp. ZSWI3]|uniref:class I SAM-dependent RNA methyltransferase n=1 Tax=Nitratireductor sp. ZSWI3 TaxID=2966359 RepID=UPI00214FA7C8|nr:class I SAM-dependent RNA methyltransferase [Nitratireductor sp. ZSWI3]MCR4266738.1 class I SAM-dependent RNA methyltransferase [Nitratireductor sp. ZSWI3]